MVSFRWPSWESSVEKDFSCSVSCPWGAMPLRWNVTPAGGVGDATEAGLSRQARHGRTGRQSTRTCVVKDVNGAAVGQHAGLEAKVVVAAKGVDQARVALQEAVRVAHVLAPIPRLAQPQLAHAAQVRLPIALHPRVAGAALGAVVEVRRRRAQLVAAHKLAQHRRRGAQLPGHHGRVRPLPRVQRLAAAERRTFVGHPRLRAVRSQKQQEQRRAHCRPAPSRVAGTVTHVWMDLSEVAHT